jgi:hypothetical protein
VLSILTPKIKHVKKLAFDLGNSPLYPLSEAARGVLFVVEIADNVTSGGINPASEQSKPVKTGRMTGEEMTVFFFNSNCRLKK